MYWTLKVWFLLPYIAHLQTRARIYKMWHILLVKKILDYVIQFSQIDSAQQSPIIRLNWTGSVQLPWWRGSWQPPRCLCSPWRTSRTSRGSRAARPSRSACLAWSECPPSAGRSEDVQKHADVIRWLQDNTRSSACKKAWYTTQRSHWQHNTQRSAEHCHRGQQSPIEVNRLHWRHNTTARRQ